MVVEPKPISDVTNVLLIFVPIILLVSIIGWTLSIFDKGIPINRDKKHREKKRKNDIPIATYWGNDYRRIPKEQCDYCGKRLYKKKDITLHNCLNKLLSENKGVLFT